MNPPDRFFDFLGFCFIAVLLQIAVVVLTILGLVGYGIFTLIRRLIGC